MQFQFGYSGLQWSDSIFLLLGALNTVKMGLCSAIIGTLLGIVLGWLRSLSLALRLITAPYIDILRSVPMIIQLILSNSLMSMAGFEVSAFWFGTLALSLWMSAVTAEVVRAAFESVPPSYIRGSRSLGMTYWQGLRHVTAPLALRAGLTPWVGLLLSLIKDSSLAGVIGYVEYMKSTQVLITRTHEVWLLLLGAGAFYFVLLYPISRLSQRLERKVLA